MNKNLKPFTKNDPRAIAAGKKGGKKSKRSRSTTAILKDLSDRDPMEIFPLSAEEIDIAKALKKIGAPTVKDFIMWQLLNYTRCGKVDAMKLYLAQLGEDKGQLLRIAGPTGDEPLQLDQLHSLSVEQLEKLQRVLEKSLA